MTVAVDIPDQVAAIFSGEGTDLFRRLLEDSIAQAFREGKLTTRGVQEALGLQSRMHVDPFLQKYQINDYTVEMLEKDLLFLEKLESQEG